MEGRRVDEDAQAAVDAAFASLGLPGAHLLRPARSTRPLAPEWECRGARTAWRAAGDRYPTALDAAEAVRALKL